MPTVALGELMASRNGSVNPASSPDETFDLYSIPAYDAGEPEVVCGRDIGSTKQCVEPNDVLLSKIVPHIRRSWVVGEDHGRRLIASGEWIVFRSKDVHPSYLRHVFLGEAFHAQFMTTVSGVGGSLLRARPSYVASIRIRLPPLPEQRRIAEVLDRAETLRAKRRAALAQLDTISESIFLDMFGDPATNPMGWPVAGVDDACDQIVDCVNRTAPLAPEATPFKMIRTTNVRRGSVDLREVRCVSEETFHRWNRRATPQRGDVLLTREAPLGEAGILESDDKVFLGQRLMLYRPDRTRTTSEYLSFSFQSAFLQRQFRAQGSGSTVKHLSVPACRNLQILLPPLNIQQVFVARVQQIRKVRALSTQSLHQLDTLFASLQHRAVRGEL